TVGGNNIHLFLSSNNIIDNNTLESGNQVAAAIILLQSLSDNNIITNNRLNGTNTVNGWFILFFSSNNNVLTNNSIYSVYAGAQNHRLYDSDNNSIIDSYVDGPGYDFYVAGDSNGHSNYVINSTSDTIGFDGSSVTDKLYIQWYLDVYVNASIGGSVEYANVTAWQSNNTQAFTILTNTQGNIPRQILTEYMQNSTAKYYTDYNNYTVNATKNSITATEEVNITGNKLIYLTLTGIHTCGTLSAADTTYILLGNVSSDGTCFTITANNITIDGNGHTINYSKVSTGYAIDNTGGYDNITVKNINIVQGDLSVTNSHAIYASGMLYGNITNNTINLSGSNGYGIYFNVSNSSTIYNNTITNSKGKIGEDARGIYILSSSENNINFNNIFGLIGGAGSNGAFFVPGSPGGDSSAIYLSSSANNTIFSNNMTSLTGGKGGTGGGNKIGGIGGITSGISLLSSSTNNTISLNYIADMTGGAGGNGGGAGGAAGAAGGITSGIYILSSSNNTIFSNNITNLTGGVGGTGYTFYIGGAGSLPSGIYLSSSENNNISLNNITKLTSGNGGNGGVGGVGAIGGAGGLTSGVYLYSSGNNTIFSNNMNNLTGGIGGIGGINDFLNVGGDGGSPSGIYLYSSENNTLSSNNMTDLLGGMGGTGGNSEGAGTGSTGGTGGLPSAIYLSSSANNILTLNSIINLTGGTGGTGGYGQYGGNGGTGGTGGSPSAIYLLSSANNTLTLNNMNNFTGGIGGTGGDVDGNGGSAGSAGSGGVSSGFYFTSSDSNKITDSNITDIADDYDTYSITDSDNFLINATFNSSRFNIIDTSSLEIQWYLDIYVNDTAGSAIESANVTAWQSNGTLGFTDLTNTQGNISRQALTEYMQNYTAKYYTDYNNYTVNATKTLYIEETEQVNLTTNKQIYFTLQVADATPPTIEFVPPTPDDGNTTNNNYAYINWTITEDNPDTTILNWNGTNTTLTNSSVNQTNLADGTYTYYVWANDTASNSNQTETRDVTIDTTSPVLSIESPENKSYDTQTIWFNVTLNEPGSWCGYSLDYENREYQENADSTSVDTQANDGYLLINYTKPEDAYENTSWMVKYGSSAYAAENISIPLECWNAYSDKLVLRLRSSCNGGTATSQPYCHNGSDWITAGDQRSTGS
ncbi:MAG: hypothetical protein KAR23_05860, partial [Candidatus Aenigmarchaeota archaeon]|nr:hypothetical protein [Candidatus Aenigmarchaeota archaeon]